MPPLRLFIAVETPPPIVPQISAIRDRLKEANADVNWESDEKLHATLKFLGNTDEKLLPEIVYYLEGVSQNSPTLDVRYHGVGCFPNKRAPRVVWVGMEDLRGSLTPLHDEIETGLTRFGFEKEDRIFHAHVTLGRVKSDRRIQSLLRIMESTTFESQPVTIREIALIRSELKPSGSVYTTLKTIPLGTRTNS
jgi:2'-5' RNA ligase